MMSDAVWFYAVGSEQRGPVNEQALMDAIGRGEVRPETLVWREGMDNWAAARASLPGAIIPQSWADALPPSLGSTPSAGSSFEQTAQSVQTAYAGHAQGGYYHPTQFVDVIRTVLSRYIQFSGRARRSEYWFWILFYVLCSIALNVIDGVLFGFDPTDIAVFGPLFALAVLLPTLALAFRRMHDTGRSAWWLLLGLIPLIGSLIILFWFVQPGDQEDNQFGPA